MDISKTSNETEGVNQKDRDTLLSELVIRVSAIEKILVEKKVCTETELAESLLLVMIKLQSALDRAESDANSSSGFIKTGNQES